MSGEPSTALAKPERRSKHSPPVDVSQTEKLWLATLDTHLLQPTILPPKPWSDDVEQSAFVKCAYGTPPIVALRCFGIPDRTAASWLSDDPPEAYRSACAALAAKLKCASDLCEAELLGRIHAASLETKHWTAAAWYLERARNYVRRDNLGASGPSVVVNIGLVNQGQSPVIKVRSLRSHDQSVAEDVSVDTPSLTGQSLTDE